jgi:hypothetical protein
MRDFWYCWHRRHESALFVAHASQLAHLRQLGGGPSVKAWRAWLKALPKAGRQPADAEHTR